MDNIMRSTGLAVSKLNPATAALASVSQRLKAHSQQITNLERTLNKACGTNTQKRRRILMQKNQLLLSTLQAHPELAENVRVTRPECDFSKCTMCGECVAMCPTFACDLKGAGRFTLESTYCVGCGLCAEEYPDLFHLNGEGVAESVGQVPPRPRRPGRRRSRRRKRRRRNSPQPWIRWRSWPTRERAQLQPCSGARFGMSRLSKNVQAAAPDSNCIKKHERAVQ